MTYDDNDLFTINLTPHDILDFATDQEKGEPTLHVMFNVGRQGCFDKKIAWADIAEHIRHEYPELLKPRKRPKQLPATTEGQSDPAEE